MLFRIFHDMVYQFFPDQYPTASIIPISAPTTPNPGDPWDGGDWSVDEGSVRVGAGQAAIQFKPQRTHRAQRNVKMRCALSGHGHGNHINYIFQMPWRHSTGTTSEPPIQPSIQCMSTCRQALV
ncbi:MAG: hypothetical protein MIO93_09300 [ANME-2 cluster archaeon]|nr:hypothetical protein [ANME-2 cluster archaeon]